MCSEQIQAEVARQHIVFVCIKICAIKWTIKCPFVIFIGLQCCKMLKAFIFSFAMTKAWSSIVHGQNVDQNFLHSFFIFLSHFDVDNNNVMTKSSRRKLNCMLADCGWWWPQSADHPNYIITAPSLSRNKHDIINRVHGLCEHNDAEIVLACGYHRS